jgi:hypothetical protein
MTSGCFRRRDEGAAWQACGRWRPACRQPRPASRPSARLPETAALERTGHDEVLGLGGEEAEALVIGRIANQQDGTVTTALCFADGSTHQRAADPLALVGGIDRQRAEQQRINGTPSRLTPASTFHRRTVPMTWPSGSRATSARAFGRHAAAAQRLGRLAAAVRAHGRSSRFSRATTSPGFSSVDSEGILRKECADRIKNSGHLGLPYPIPIQTVSKTNCEGAAPA